MTKHFVFTEKELELLEIHVSSQGIPQALEMIQEKKNGVVVLEDKSIKRITVEHDYTQPGITAMIDFCDTQLKEYTNEELNRLCAEAQGWKTKHSGFHNEEVWWHKETCNGEGQRVKTYTPTTDKRQAMELLERFKLELSPSTVGAIWHAGSTSGHIFETAPTPSLAIAKAVAAMQLEKEND